MLNERVLRKPEWTEGAWITLADGQSWCFPKPMLREFRPVFSADGLAKFGASLNSFGPGYLARLDALMACEPGIEQIEMVATIGADLLRKNYDLDDDQLGSLLCYVMTDDGELEEDCHDMWQSICNVAAGVAGKPMPAGSASA